MKCHTVINFSAIFTAVRLSLFSQLLKSCVKSHVELRGFEIFSKISYLLTKKLFLLSKEGSTFKIYIRHTLE